MTIKSRLLIARTIFVPIMSVWFLAIASGNLRLAVGAEYESVWAWWTGGGALLGVGYWHTYRGTGFAPYVATVAAGACIWASFGGWCVGTVAVTAACLGFLFVRFAAFSIRFGVAGGSVCFVLSVAGWPFLMPGVPAASVLVLTAVFAVFSWYWFFRPCFELTCEPVMWWMYKIRSAGPGLKELPSVGPCLVLANHAAWLDPLFLAKVLPRRTTPMMTSKFYDKPVIGWLVRRFGVIRVPEKALKQDTPEIREAIAALDRGECVVIFPEGFLRRTEDKPLKRFGRGVWQILCERPNTPVFTAWIEGGWGSYTSYCNGKPMQNKKRDFRRPIGIGVSGAVVVPAEELEHHLRTRIHLMNLVLEARKLLGLPELPMVELPSREDEE